MRLFARYVVCFEYGFIFSEIVIKSKQDDTFIIISAT